MIFGAGQAMRSAMMALTLHSLLFAARSQPVRFGGETMRHGTRWQYGRSGYRLQPPKSRGRHCVSLRRSR
jgi:hypothetical protein